jgi:hypothetical protein
LKKKNYINGKNDKKEAKDCEITKANKTGERSKAMFLTRKPK